MIIVKINGGLGNQLFQYAIGKELSIRNNQNLKLDITAYEESSYRPYELDVFNLDVNIASKEEINQIKQDGRHYKEKHFHFNPKVLDLNSNTFLEGYWQSEKYFITYKNVIQKDLALKNKLSQQSSQFHKLILSTTSVSLHIRRGDYVTNPATNSFIGRCSIEYYKNAVNHIEQRLDKPHFFIFSDDLDWAKENLDFINNITFIELDPNVSNYEEMYLMSKCEHNIIANSSFSWWGAWLNQNVDKIVIAPKKWFQDETINTNDVIPDSWLRLSDEHQEELMNRTAKNTLESNMVSIIIPAFNVEKDISRCLDSVINQTHKNIEIIVVNDASTDNTRNIVEQYIQMDRRITCIDKETNAGLLQARMTGMKKAKGSYIYSVDSDDYVMPDLVKDTLEEALKHNADIVQFPMRFSEEDSKYTDNWTRKKYQEYTKNNFFSYNGNSWTIMFKKELGDILRKHIGSVSVNYHEDYIISIILSAFYKKVRYIDTAYYVYCDTATSMSRQYSDEAILKYIRDTFTFTKLMKDLVPIIFPKENSDYLFTIISDRIRLMKNQLNLYFKESKNVNIYDLYNNTNKNKTFITNSMLYETIQIKDTQLKQKDTQLEQKDTQLKQKDTQLEQKDTQLEQKDTQLTQLNQKLGEKDQQLKQQKSKINKLVNNRWYRFGKMSKKRKIWTIAKVMSKKTKTYWLFKPVANSMKGFLDSNRNKIIHTLDLYNNCIVYDKGWQHPAITEQHAFHMIRDSVIYNKDSIYLAFPWATLIDLLDTGSHGSDILLNVLTQIKKKITGKKNIITVCQHIKMLKYQNMFAEMGITDLFWTHAINDQDYFPEYNEIKIHPFPLYPVQVKNTYDSNDQRKYLYSFVGARANEWYLTQSRNYIIDILSTDNRGLVLGRDSWHYNKIVYDHQIKKEVDPNMNLVDKNASTEFQNIVKQSIFSLCPSGSGPNSIRLWESIGFGAIPVILADTYLPPGNLKLWDEAVVYCEETEDAIKELPNRLEEMTKDSELLKRKRHAMKQLWMMYGPDCFIYDIQKLLLSSSKSAT